MFGGPNTPASPKGHFGSPHIWVQNSFLFGTNQGFIPSAFRLAASVVRPFSATTITLCVSVCALGVCHQYLGKRTHVLSLESPAVVPMLTPLWTGQVSGQDKYCLPGWGVVSQGEPCGTARFLGAALLLLLVANITSKNPHWTGHHGASGSVGGSICRATRFTITNFICCS